MGKTVISVKMEHHKIQKELLEQIENLLATQLWYATRALPYRIKTILRRCDIEIDVKIASVKQPEVHPVEVFIDEADKIRTMP